MSFSATSFLLSGFILIIDFRLLFIVEVADVTTDLGILLLGAITGTGTGLGVEIAISFLEIGLGTTFRNKGKSRNVFNFFFHRHLKRKLIASSKFRLTIVGSCSLYTYNQHRIVTEAHPVKNQENIFLFVQNIEL